MSDSEGKFFSSTELGEILEYLNEVLREEDKLLVLRVYGGAAIMLYYGEQSRNVTEDIDAIIENRREFSSADAHIFTKVQRRFGLADDWINSKINEGLIGLSREDLLDFKKFSNLYIQIPSKEQLLAMKVYSARIGTKYDYDDAKQLIQDLGLKTRDAIYDIAYRYLPKHEIDNTRTRLFVSAIADELGLG